MPGGRTSGDSGTHGGRRSWERIERVFNQHPRPTRPRTPKLPDPLRSLTSFAKGVWQAVPTLAKSVNDVLLATTPRPARRRGHSRTRGRGDPVEARASADADAAAPASPRPQSVATPERYVDGLFPDRKRHTYTTLSDWESGSALVPSVGSPRIRQGVDFIGTLPAEVIAQIALSLDGHGLVAALQVSRVWRQALDRPLVWKQLYLENAQPRRQPLTRQPGLSVPRGRALPLAKPEKAGKSSRCTDWKSMYRTWCELERNWAAPTLGVHALEGHQDSVYCARVHGNLLVTGSTDRTVKLWNLTSRQPLHTLSGHEGSVLCLAVDTDLLVTGSSDGTFMVWKLPELESLGRIAHHTARVLDVALMDDYIVTCSRDSSIAVWDRRRLTLVRTITEAHSGAVNAIATHGPYIFSGGKDAVARQWHAVTGECVQTFRGHTGRLACIAVDSLRNQVITGSDDRTVRVWDVHSGVCTMILGGHSHLVRSLHVLPTKIVSASYDRTVKVWDIKTGRLITNHKGWHGGWIYCVCANATSIVTTSMGIKPVVFDFTGDIPSERLAQLL